MVYLKSYGKDWQLAAIPKTLNDTNNILATMGQSLANCTETSGNTD